MLRQPVRICMGDEGPGSSPAAMDRLCDLGADLPSPVPRLFLFSGWPCPRIVEVC